MARSAVEHNEQVMIRVGFGESFEETLQALTIHPWQV
jgi:hypothetical protein